MSGLSMGNGGVRVLLVYPPSRTQVHATCPVGLLMLGTVLEAGGHTVHLLDANALKRRLCAEEVAAEVARLRPDVVGITLLTPLVRETYRLASLLRGNGVRLLAGGPHATLLPEEPLRNGFDAVVVGEGEPVIDLAVRALTGRIPMDAVPGWRYRTPAGGFDATAPCPPPRDLDALPFPDRRLADPACYAPLRESAVLFTSRGCPARCAYCAGGLFGKSYRFRSADNVLEEIVRLHERHGTGHLHFVDDAMSIDRDRMVRLCQGLLDRKLPVTWSMMTRVDAVDEAMLKMARQAGCTDVHYGIESGSPETLKKIHKPHTLEMVRRIVPLTARVGISPYVFFILGFPWEDVAMVEQTRQLMAELAPYVPCFHPAIASILVPFPGTEIYEKHRERYGFDEWWLGTERNYDAPTLATHPYHETVMFRNGAVLDADFFHYTPDVKRKIRQVFRFMHFHNLRSASPIQRAARRTFFHLSAAFADCCPRTERLLVGGLARAARRRRGAHAAGHGATASRRSR